MPEAGSSSDASGDVEALTNDLLETFREALGRPDLGPEDRFLGSGGDSLTVMEIILDLEARHGVSISAAEFMALDSASALARHVVSRKRGRDDASAAAPPTGDERRSFISVVQNGARVVPLVCAYGQSGEAAWAITLADHLPKEQPLATLQVSRERVLAEGGRSLREIARDDAQQVLGQYPDRPCALLGYSLGAHVALALSHELGELGASTAFMAVLDDSADLEKRHFGALREEQTPRTVRELYLQALRRSPAEPMATRIVYFRSAEDEAYYRSDPTSGWGEIATGGVTPVDVPVRHREFPRGPGLSQIAPRLMEEVARTGPPAAAPGSAQMLRYEARRAARKGDLSAEISLSEAAIGQDSEQPAWFYANLAEARFQQGDTVAALSALGDARRRESWPLALDLRFLGEFRRRGLDDECQAVVRRLSRLKPDHPSVNEQMARAFLHLGLREEAARELRAGLAIAPDHFRLSVARVRLLRQEAAWSELLPLAEKLVETYPANHLFRAALVDACAGTGAADRAFQFRDAIVGASPADPEGLLTLARASLRHGRATEALELVELALEASPKRPGAHLLRRECLLALGRRDEAAIEA